MQCNKKLNLAEKIVYRNFPQYIKEINIIKWINGKEGLQVNNFYFTHNLCGHWNNDHIDHPSDLINASEKENKLEETKMKNKCDHIDEYLTFLTYCADCMECKKYVEHHQATHPQVIHKFPYIYGEKSRDQYETKHPCGKVFDVSKKFKAMYDDKILDFAISEKQIIIETDSGFYGIQKCGHLYSDHTSSTIDLVNVPQVKEIDLDKIYLQKEDGALSLRYKDKESILGLDWFLLKINKDGTVRRELAISRDLGFQLDEYGRIKLDE